MKAVFSLACKCQPCIIYMDEIDAFLRDRSSADHEATSLMKAEFLRLFLSCFCGADHVEVYGMV